MHRIILVFASPDLAVENVAGLPVIARAAHLAQAEVRNFADKPSILLAVRGGWSDDSWSRQELSRLAPGLAGHVLDLDAVEPMPGDLWLAGEWMLQASHVSEACKSFGTNTLPAGVGHHPDVIRSFHAAQSVEMMAGHFRQESRNILKSSVKATDGIVSRYVNRPISTRISGLLLQHRNVRPIHATLAAALTAVIMFACLVSGSSALLILGAVLFQVASMLDGVDGEIARATVRSSARGASLDSITDGATNLGFLIGLGIGLHKLGDSSAIAIGSFGFACLGAGLCLLGLHAVSSGQAVNFDALKHVVRRYPAPLSDWLIWITMRDFLALFSAIMVSFGYGSLFLRLFAFGAAIWLVVTIGFICATRFGFGRPLNGSHRNHAQDET